MVAEKSALTTSDLNSAILGEGLEKTERKEDRIVKTKQDVERNDSVEKKTAQKRGHNDADLSSLYPFKEKGVAASHTRKRLPLHRDPFFPQQQQQLH